MPPSLALLALSSTCQAASIRHMPFPAAFPAWVGWLACSAKYKAALHACICHALVPLLRLGHSVCNQAFTGQLLVLLLDIKAGAPMPYPPGGSPLVALAPFQRLQSTGYVPSFVGPGVLVLSPSFPLAVPCEYMAPRLARVVPPLCTEAVHPARRWFRHSCLPVTVTVHLPCHCSPPLACLHRPALPAFALGVLHTAML